MTPRIPLYIYSTDAISQLGMTSHLTNRPELQVLPEADQGDAVVTLVVTDAMSTQTVSALRQLRRGGSRLVLVSGSMDESQMATAVECGVVGVVRRADASADRLVEVIKGAARGEGSIPADLLGHLLDQMGRLHRELLDPRGLSLRSLTNREVDVLRLIADGLETREIASKLSYSERTVKNVIHELTTRLQLRNRAHAVAYALRHDLI
jgi:DNA-binding NarL/FixJ family response regulator